MTFSDGQPVDNPRHERRGRAVLARAQRELARKEKGSRNREKARVRVARVHARVADRRRDMWHQVTTRLVRDNQVLVIEDLAVTNMLRNHTLARAISDVNAARNILAAGLAVTACGADVRPQRGTTSRAGSRR